MFRFPHKTRRPRLGGSNRNRQGAATVELAVTLPIIFLIAFGSVQAASMTFLRQALVQSAYETVKESVRVRGSQQAGIIRGQQVLAFRNITANAPVFDPSDVENADRGTPVTVTLSAPSDANTIFPFGLFAGTQIRVEATMLKE